MDGAGPGQWWPGASGGRPIDDLGGTAADYLRALLGGEDELAVDIVVKEADSGVDARHLVEEVLAPAQRELGRLWQLGRITVGVEHRCTAVTQLALDALQARGADVARHGWSLVALAAPGNSHQLGIQMVADVFARSGWAVTLLGQPVTPDQVVEAVATGPADLLLVSATLMEHVAGVAEVVRAVRADVRTARTVVLGGGSPLASVPERAASLGLDGVAGDALHGVRVAEELVAARA